MRLAVVCPYPVGCAPSQRLKYEQYFPSWRAAGYEVEVFPFWDAQAWAVLYDRGARWAKVSAVRRGLARRRRDLAKVLQADLIYLHLEATPIGPPWFERALIRSGRPFVYDIDDLVHLPHGSAANPFMRRLRGAWRHRKVVELIEAAVHVIVCTEYLHQFASRHNPTVTDIPSTIDTDRYRPPSRPPASGLVIGWSGSHSTSPYLHLLDGVLGELARSTPFTLRVIGDPSFDMPGVEVQALPWRAATEVEDLSAIDIGVYPLPDEEWVLGKSGLKALQYMALGIPTVAERIGSNLRIVEHGRNGMLADTPEAWSSHLRELARDPALRARLGAAARETVLERYSVRANEPRYLDVLAAAAGAEAA